MNASQVLARFEQVKANYATKDDEIDRIKGYLDGRYYDDFAEGTTLRDEPKYSTIDGTIKLVVNLPFLTVQDNTALAAQDPQIDVPPRDDKSESHALKLKKIHYATYEQSGGNWLMQQSTYYERAYGWSVMGALPNLKDKRVELVSYDPRCCYPVFKLGSKVFLRELFVAWKETPASVKAQYPNFQTDGESEDEKVDVVMYFSEDERAVFADGQLLNGIKHGWGFVPFVVIPCMQTPSGLGIGDVHQTVGLAIAGNKLHNLMYQYIYENVNADTAVFSDDDIDPPVGFQGRKLWKFSRDSRQEKMSDTSGRMLEAFRMISEIQSQHGAISGTSSARMGQREGMYVSGGGQAALMQPLGNRIDNSLRIKAERMSIVFEYALRLYEKHFSNTKLNLYGRMGKIPFEVNFKGKDIKGYYRVNVSWLPAILHDAGNRMIQLLQQNKGRLISNYTTTNLLGIADPEFEKKQIEEELFAQAKVEGAMQRVIQEQAMPQTPPPGLPLQSTNPDEIPYQQQQLEKGRTNETAEGLFGLRGGGAVPPGAGAPPASGGQPMPMPVLPNGAGGVPPDATGAGQVLYPDFGGGVIPENIGDDLDTLQELADAIRNITKIRGQVYIVGKAAATGSITKEDDLELAITNPLDKQTIINALPGLKGRIVFHRLTGEPEEEHLEATPGTEGYEPAGIVPQAGMEQMMTPEAGAPPDLMSMLTGGTQ